MYQALSQSEQLLIWTQTAGHLDGSEKEKTSLWEGLSLFCTCSAGGGLTSRSRLRSSWLGSYLRFGGGLALGWGSAGSAQPPGFTHWVSQQLPPLAWQPGTSPDVAECCLGVVLPPDCLVAESPLTLCDPTDCSLPVSSVPGILQARTLEWVAISFSNPWLEPLI